MDAALLFSRNSGPPCRPLGLSARAGCKRRCLKVRAGESERAGSGAARLTELLRGPGIVQGPCCFDALSASLVQASGFPVAVMSGARSL
jgi:hypothetical protein